MFPAHGRGWNETSFKVASNPKHSGILSCFFQGAHTEDLADQHQSPSEHQGPGGWCKGEDPEGAVGCGMEMWGITFGR